MAVFRQPSINLVPRRLGAILLLLIVAVISVHCHPGLLPQRDSGVFLYIGQRILAGEVPYRDIWDHKGPFLYLINALGLWMTGGDGWGVWILQFTTLAWATITLHRILYKNFGVVAGTVGMLLTWPLFLNTFEGGNFSEVYAIPIQVAAILVTLNTFTRADSRTRLRFVSLGIILSCAALLRPNNLGTPAVAGFLALFGTPPNTRARRLCDFLIGCAAPLVLTFLYLVSNDALQPFYDQYFVYNLYYVRSGAELFVQTSRLVVAKYVLELLTFPGSWIVLSLGAVSSLNRPPSPTNNRQRLTLLATFALIVEFALSLLAGTERPHYFLLLIVPLSIVMASGLGFATYLFARLLPRSIRVRGLMVFVGVIGLMIHPMHRRLWPSLIGISSLRFLATENLATALSDTTQHYDTMLVWGAEARINFIANKPSPSKFVYLYPLMQCGYSPPEMPALRDQFVKDIIATKPLIVDASTTSPRVVPLNKAERSAWLAKHDHCNLQSSFAPLFAFVDAEYHEVQTLTGAHWKILAPNTRLISTKPEQRAGELPVS